MAKKTSSWPIQHVIVLMLENRSFDHMLGWLKPGDPVFEGLDPLLHHNYADPHDPGSERIQVKNLATPVTDPDPAHDIESTNRQLYGTALEPAPNVPTPNNGFVYDYARVACGDLTVGRTIMDCFNPSRLPILSTLAKEFCVCNHWHASVPGPTWPNRFFVHAATSYGRTTNAVLPLFDRPTVFGQLEAQWNKTPGKRRYPWGIYFDDIAQSMVISELYTSKGYFREFGRFKEDVKNDDLPSYSFIEPRYFDFFGWKANDQHPPHDVCYGERLIRHFYQALRHSKVWDKCLLVVMYDEHGGFYDHLAIKTNVVAPDKPSASCRQFSFDRLGLRVPAILISPLMPKGSVNSDLLEHASVPKTLQTLFGLPGTLTKRDAQANDLLATLLPTPRVDTPEELPEPPVCEATQCVPADEPELTVGAVRWAMQTGLGSLRPLTEIQQSLVELARELETTVQGRALAQTQIVTTEHDGAVFCRRAALNFLASRGRP